MSTADKAIETLTRAGFVPDGETRTETVRVPTKRSPLYGGLGGELRTFGGRMRLAVPGTSIRATVGPRTTNIYRVKNGKTEFLANLDTKNVAAIERAAAEAVAQEPRE